MYNTNFDNAHATENEMENKCNKPHQQTESIVSGSVVGIAIACGLAD
jgi:hypothetical protein